MGTRPGVQLGGHGSRRDGVLVLPFGKGTSHGPGASQEVGGSAQGAAIVLRRSLAGVLLLFSLQIVGADAGAEERDVAAESCRAGQDATLDLEVDFDALRYESSDPMADNPPEDSTPEWDRHPRVDWSRRAGKSWELDPVLLHRRQAGQPQRPGDDLSNKALGIELRRRF